MGDDEEYDTQKEIKRIIIGLIFIGSMPVLLVAATDVDVLQGCIVFSDADIKHNKEFTVIDEDGTETTITAEEGQCKPLSSKDGFINAILDDIQYYVPLALGLFFLAMGIAIIAGPGIRILRHQFNK